MANTINSPRAMLIPFISSEAAATTAYPPDALPGSRDVETFYGCMRVYEWGPLDGDKVLFVHGDATPCLVFSKISQGLADAGYRVMLFDLWGRGYSDTPLDCRHDVRLFATQILLAITSSNISWLGSGTAFSIIAFSLGAPISLAFTAAYPSSVRSLVLLGPAGLLRKLPDGYDDQLMQRPDLAPCREAIRDKVRQILEVASYGPGPDMKLDQRRLVPPPERAPSRVERAFDMGALLQWQFDHHHGHVHSFQDTIRYGPLQAAELWKKACNMIAGRTESDTPLRNKKLLVFFGKDDGVVVGEETTEDVLTMLPSSLLQTEYLPGGHGFPYPNSESITHTILSFWNSGHS